MHKCKRKRVKKAVSEFWPVCEYCADESRRFHPVGDWNKRVDWNPRHSREAKQIGYYEADLGLVKKPYVSLAEFAFSRCIFPHVPSICLFKFYFFLNLNKHAFQK